MTDLTGIVLAAGAGRRMGAPKSLMRTVSGDPWSARAVDFLRESGCDRFIVVLGAEVERSSALAPVDAEIVVAEHWEQGMSASLRAGILAASGAAALITLVDLPELPSSVGQRVVGDTFSGSTLRRAVFLGRPGHPVLVGAEHWQPLIATLDGDRGAQSYLKANDALEIECGDLSDGRDIDT
ncbi:nucleotidyltransferase family protein [Lacisediminihabitans changchengi]|uniref:Nucleotidyltransferase family protein n=1 Tax=Lacisediminihabitans changchengi TaxID=2787634 RepID=A0A934SJC6_9MICO|nr:nucleotidyltransferase family protein [Lacisediminihabitans changchengi]MBK4346346.1 nucleotidyltransferase family protein [Lacisediminihabitans changchengi]